MGGGLGAIFQFVAPLVKTAFSSVLGGGSQDKPEAPPMQVAETPPLQKKESPAKADEAVSAQEQSLRRRKRLQARTSNSLFAQALGGTGFTGGGSSLGGA